MDTEANAEILKDPKIETILHSELGLSILNDRIKSHLNISKELANFLKKRSVLEEQSAKDLQKIAKSFLETFQDKNPPSTSFPAALIKSLQIHEQLASNSFTQQKALSTCSDEVLDFYKNCDRKRKSIKEYAKRQENTYLEAVIQMDKSKARFKSAEHDYNHTLDQKNASDNQKKVGFFKPKSNAQLSKLEEEARSKAESAESDMKSKIQNAQTAQQELLLIHRPNYIKQFFSLQREIEAALNCNYLRYSKLCETHTVMNGLLIRPQTPSTKSSGFENALDNFNSNADFRQYVLDTAVRRKNNQNPSDASKTKIVQPPSSYGPANQSSTPPSINISIPSNPTHISSQSTSNFNRPMTSHHLQSANRPKSDKQETLPSTANALKPSTPISPISSKTSPSPTKSETHHTNVDQQSATVHESSNTNVTQLPPLTKSPSQTSASTKPPSPDILSSHHANATQKDSPPKILDTSILFGAHLEAILLREHSNVPNIVVQCTSQIETFGLNLQGIYRIPSSAAKVSALRHQFTVEPLTKLNSPKDYGNDIHSLADLLKSFFRELSEPLIPNQHYNDFIEAGNVDDEARRRDAVHRAINDLPDANYSTIRHITIHLAKIKENSDVNKMSTNNLAIIWGPTLLKQATIPEISSFSRTIEILIDYCFTIFDYD
ncbi:rho-type GTPase activating protein Rga7 [Schizosaccharomyces cryophilus OY26]|uniref:Rho-type GTPase activating protein Rga7 n=1 Tax=Schizosaccharomyces cryophilus (strain OY26 / ATCC MYA-4695 / CBS 11777 / NBRC 106824 / NRRL Y48691) TaxID=653667 RepID=S9VTV5_SCHCR|nr:rho-type GTPase activating protein Rga7 [Schizosaccharomyces cryophilus OY26]EPY49604.1 rho-type GTPase activating protein Rga7 [Schizosaccharomyces cryophilus OY26]